MRFRVTLSVRGQQNPDTMVLRTIKGAEIKMELLRFWQLHSWQVSEATLIAQGDDYFNMETARGSDKTAEPRDALANLLLQTIWQANGEYCPIHLTVTELAEPPLYVYNSQPATYLKLMERDPEIFERTVELPVRISS